MATKAILQSLLELAGQFVIDRKNNWNHDDWEALLTKMAAKGIIINDESKRNLGNILESCKYFYEVGGAVPPKKRAAAKSKAKSKAKAKGKAKKSA